MAEMQEKYDTAFAGILQNEGQIGNFLDSVFSFLYRRTDFFLTMTSKEDKMGFPPGVPIKLTVGAFQKYEKMAKADAERRMRAAEKLKKKEEDAKMDTNPPIAVKEEVVTANIAESDATQESNLPETKDSASLGAQAQAEGEKDSKSPSVEMSEVSAADGKSKDETSGGNRASGDADDDVDPEMARKQAIYQANPLSYNGAIRDSYSWGQSITDVDAYVKVPKHIKQGRCVNVVIHKKHLKVSYRESSGETVVLVDDSLQWEINCEESMWTLVPGEYVHVNMEKVQERWWEQLVSGEEKISIRKIDPSRPMTDLDDEAQAKIGEMMYNERQKKLGLPQSHEQKAHGILKEAWDAEGSPFKGQPFDPSKLNISANSAMDLAKFS